MQQKRFVKSKITKKMQIRASRTLSKTPQKYLLLSSTGHREYRVQMMFLVPVSINPKLYHKKQQNSHWDK